MTIGAVLQGALYCRSSTAVVAYWALILGVSIAPGQPPKIEPLPLVSETEVLAEFEIAGNGDCLLVPVTVSGKEYQFCVDTGATATLYDLSLRSELEARVGETRVSATGGDVTVDLYQPPRATLGRIELPTDSAVACADLEGVRRASGHNFRGILGMDVLSKYVIELDFDNGKLCFVDRMRDSTGVPVELHGTARFPRVLVDVPGGGLQSFLVDTGANYSSIDEDLFDRLERKGKLSLIGEKHIRALTRVQTSRSGRVKSIQLEDFSHRGVVFGEGRQSTLGLDYWIRYCVTFDFPHGVAYLNPGRQFDRVCHQDLSGLHILRIEGHAVIEIVDAGSPAEAARILEQDRIDRIDSQSVDRWTLFELRRLLKNEGRHVRMTIHRGDQQLEVDMQLRNWCRTETPAPNH